MWSETIVISPDSQMCKVTTPGVNQSHASQWRTRASHRLDASIDVVCCDDVWTCGLYFQKTTCMFMIGNLISTSNGNRVSHAWWRFSSSRTLHAQQTLGNPRVLGPRPMKTEEDQWKPSLCRSSCPVKKNPVGSPSMGTLMLKNNEVP